MAYDKKYPNLEDDILAFDKDQEDRTEQGFSDLSAELMGEINSLEVSVNDSIDELDKKIDVIADYPIEIGRNTNGEYEKWKSGKLIMRGIGNIPETGYEQTTPGGFGGWYSPAVRIRLPYTLLTKDNVIINANLDGQAYRSPWISSLHIADVNNIEIRVSQNTSSTVGLKVYWEVVGKWK